MIGVLRELVARFDINTAAAEANVRRLDGVLGKTAGALGKIATAFAGAFMVRAVGGFIKGQIQAGDQLVDTAAKLGVGTDELQKFQYGAGLASVSADAAAQSLGFLNKNLGEAAMGGKTQAEAFQRLGISIKNADGSVRRAGDLVPELAEGFKGLGSQAERTALAQRLFGRSGAQLLPFLQQGGEAVEKLNKEFADLGGGMSKEFLEASDKAGDEMFRLNFAMQGLKSTMVLAIVPALTSFFRKASKLAAGLNKLAKETNLGKAAWIGMTAAASAGLIKMAAHALKFLGLLGPFGLVLAIFVVLAAVLEDIWIGMKGGQSLTRDWLNEVLGFEEADRLFQNFNSTVDGLKGNFEEISRVLKGVGIDLGAITDDYVPSMGRAFAGLLKIIGAAVSTLGAFAEAWVKIAVDQDFSGAAKALKAGASKVVGEQGFFRDAKDVGKTAAGLVGGAWVGELGGKKSIPKSDVFGTPAAPAAPADVDVRNTVNVTVNGGTTNAETGRVVANAVKPAVDWRAVKAAADGGG
jgi:hypothetical protein